jgi:hypothetical protein
MNRLRTFFATCVLSAAIAALVSPAAGVAAGPPDFARAPSFAGPPTVLCTPSWGSLVLPFCV